MPNYKNSKIYKITSGDLTYIGSTTQKTLAKRLANHVSNYRRWKAGIENVCSSSQLIESGQYEISLIELCPCESKDELTARERFYVETMTCVNKQVPGQTQKEYRQANKETISTKRKIYREDNPEKMKERNQKYRETNRDKINTYKRNRYAKLQSNQ